MKPIAVFCLLIASSGSAETLTFDNGRLYLPARINGVVSEALLDSAAEASIVDPALATRAKLDEGQAITIRGSGGANPARFVEGVTLEAIGISLQPEGVVIADLTALSNRLLKRPTQLVLGRELFDAARLRVDIAGRSVAVVDGTSTPPGKSLALTKHAGVESISVKADGVDIQAEFDLGNGSGLLISRALATRLRLKVIGREAGGGIGGEVIRDVVAIGSLEVAGKHFSRAQAAIDDQPNANDLNIGTSVLQHFLITTDFRQRTIWLQPVGSVS